MRARGRGEHGLPDVDCGRGQREKSKVAESPFSPTCATFRVQALKFDVSLLLALLSLNSETEPRNPEWAQELKFLVGRPQWVVSFLLNQCGSVVYYFLLGTAGMCVRARLRALAFVLPWWWLCTHTHTVN